MSRVQTNIMKTTITHMALITILCCVLVIFGTAEEEHCGLMFVSAAAALIDVMTLTGWIIWALYVRIKKMVLKPLPHKTLLTLDTIGCILFVYWILIRIFPSFTGAWIIPIVSLTWIISLFIAIKGSDRQSG